MRIGDVFLAVAPPQVRVDRPTLDGTGPDERHLHHEVVEARGAQPRQRRHLRATLHLEHTDGVGRGEQRVHLGLLRDRREVDLHPFVLLHEVDREMQHGEHPEAQQVELHEPCGGAVVLVPLEHRAVLHARPLHRAELRQRPVGEHHAARMDAEVPREVEHLLGQIEREPGYRGCVLVGLQPVERPRAMTPVVWSRSLGAGIPGPRTLAAPPVHPLGERVGVPR